MNNKTLSDFPQFMRNPLDEVEVAGPTVGLKGYVYECKGGTQMVLWTSDVGGSSTEHSHDYDEYAIIIKGTYTGVVGGKEVTCGPGEEIYIPAGVPHSGSFTPGYRAIDGFGGKRVKRLHQ